MIIRVVLIVFVSGASAVSYLAGITRLMSSLLVGFGALASLFFGILFMLPAEKQNLWFPVYGQGDSWPFFLLAAVLGGITILFFTKKRDTAEVEPVSSLHFQLFIAALVGYLLSVFLPALLWFPSDARRLSLDASTLWVYALTGTCLYLFGTAISLYLFYRAAQGTTAQHPDLMRRAVLTVFSVIHFDKMPAFVAFLLVYSPEARIIYPSIAALALAGYIPIALFLLKLSRQSENV